MGADGIERRDGERVMGADGIEGRDGPSHSIRWRTFDVGTSHVAPSRIGLGEAKAIFSGHSKGVLTPADSRATFCFC
jgi:hypothetical protein